MLRRLLEDRFALNARVENRSAPGYALRRIVNATAGPRLKPSSNECLGPYTDPPPDALASTPRCPFRFDIDRIEVRATTMSEFARLLSERSVSASPANPSWPAIGWAIVNRPTVDDTGLQGRYDIVVTTGLPSKTPDGFDAETLRELYPTAFRDALRTQLGLELLPATLPMPSLVIERAQPPVED